MKQRARLLLRQAARLARLADASTLRDDQRAEIARLRDAANRLKQERMQKMLDLERAASHPATHHTAAAWGADTGEPLPEFPRALRRTLLELDVSPDLADRLVDTGEGPSGGQKGKGNKGGRKGEKGGRKGEKGKGEWHHW